MSTHPEAYLRNPLLLWPDVPGNEAAVAGQRTRFDFALREGGTASWAVRGQSAAIRHILEQCAATASCSVSIEVILVEPAQSSGTEPQRARNEGALRLLRQWLADESGYDEHVWPTVKKTIEENRLSYRGRFRD